MFYTYVLLSQEGYRYIWQTENIEKRLQAHNSWTSFWTKRGTNWRIIHQEEYPTRAEAMQREKYLKTGHGRAELDQLMILAKQVS